MLKSPFPLTPRQRRHALWSLKAIVAVLALITLVGFVLAPWLLKSVVAEQVGQELGRKLEFGTVRVNPFMLSASLRQVKLYEADRRSVAFSANEIYANASLASLLRLAPVVTELRIEQPQLLVVRQSEQRFNFSDVIEKMQARPKDNTATPAFSVANVSVHNGNIRYDDQLHHVQHQLSAIQLGIPFLSSLPRGINVFTQPAFSAQLDGSPLTVSGRTRPFATDHHTALQLQLSGLPLAEFVRLAPPALNVKLQQGKLDMQLSINFQKNADANLVVISGKLALHDLQLQDRHGAPLLQARQIAVQLQRFEPFQRLLQIGDLQIDEPQLYARRTADAGINWLQPLVRVTTPAQAPTAAAVPSPAPAKPFQLHLKRATIRDGQLDWRDSATGAKPVHLHAKQLRATLVDWHSGSKQPAQLQASLVTDAGARMHYDGKLTARTLDGKLQLDGVPLQSWQPYAEQILKAEWGATLLDANLPHQLDWSGKNTQLRVQDGQLQLRKLQLRLASANSAAIGAEKIALEGLQVDLTRHTAHASQLLLEHASVAASRRADGSIDLLAALSPQHDSRAEPQAANRRSTAGPQAASWQLSLQRLQLAGGELRFSDAAVAQDGSTALQHRFSGLDLTLDNLVYPLASGSANPASKLTWKTSYNQHGSLSGDGSIRWQPFAAELKIDAQQLDLTAAQPYLAQYSNAVIRRGNLDAHGTVQLQTNAKSGPEIGYDGTLQLNDMRGRDRFSGNDFVRWKSLSAQQVELRASSNRPFALSTGAIALTDLFARVIVNPDGHLNLQQIVARPQAGQRAVAAPATPSGNPAAARVAAARTTDSAQASIQIGRITLQRGNVRFTDNFVKPNYSANLTDLNGTVERLSSKDPKPAQLSLQGKLDGDSPITVNGSLNPLSEPLFLDLAARARGIELTRFSPYARKYAGYTIVKGKLSADVRYHVEDGKLQAQNKLLLNQLTLGDKVDSPDAVNLPLQLAIALLRNSRGEINLNLPVSGSLSDPDFSIGAVIGNAFVNLLTKAISAPFSLLASAFDSDDNLGYIEFDAGNSTLTADASTKLQTLAKAINDRPELTLEITGHADPDTDRSGAARLYVERKLRLQKAAELRAQGRSVALADVTIEPPEREKYLQRVYAAEKFDKPRNFLGLAKSLPAADMERLLRQHAPIGDAELKALADQRALNAKKYLEQQGKVDGQRMFLLASQLAANDAGKDGNADRGKSPVANSVEFTLAQ